MGILNEANRWFELASCKTVLDAGGVDYWFRPEPGDDDYEPHAGTFPAARSHVARRICGECPVRLQCLTYAIEREEVHGVWGGLTPEQRIKLIRELDGLPAAERLRRIREIATAPVHLPRLRHSGEQRERVA